MFYVVKLINDIFVQFNTRMPIVKKTLRACESVLMYNALTVK